MGKLRKTYWIIWLQNEDRLSALLYLLAFCSEYIHAAYVQAE